MEQQAHGDPNKGTNPTKNKSSQNDMKNLKKTTSCKEGQNNHGTGQGSQNNSIIVRGIQII